MNTATDRTEAIPLQVVSALPKYFDGRGEPGELKRGPMLRVTMQHPAAFTHAMFREYIERMERRGR